MNSWYQIQTCYRWLDNGYPGCAKSRNGMEQNGTNLGAHTLTVLTRKVHLSKLVEPVLSRSFSLPGVATHISTPFMKLHCCGSFDTPP